MKAFRKLSPCAQHLGASIRFAQQYKDTCLVNSIFLEGSFWDDQYEGIVERLKELEQEYQKVLNESEVES